MEKKWIVAIALVVVFAVSLFAYSLGVESGEESEGTAWTSKHETVKQVSFKLGAKEDKHVRFFLPTSSAWRKMRFSVDMESSGDVNVALWQYEDKEWNKKREWKGVSSLKKRFSYHDGGNMSLQVINNSINIFESKDVSVEIARSWEERE